MISIPSNFRKSHTMFERDHLLPGDTAAAPNMQSFRSQVNHMMKNSVAGEKALTLKQIREYFKLLPMVEVAFSKLLAEIDYPMSKWKETSVDCYLRHSLKFMEFLNLVNSCLFHLRQGRLYLLHGLGLLESSPDEALAWLRSITVKEVCIDFWVEDAEECDVIFEASTLWFWVCYTALSCLSSERNGCIENRRKIALLSSSIMNNLEVVERGCDLEELVDINKGVARLIVAIKEGKDLKHEGKEMSKKLKLFEHALDSLQKEVERLFFNVLSSRDKLLDGLRLG